MKGNNNTTLSKLKAKFIKFYKCELKTFNKILGIK